jgi:hypothetical protein
MLGEELQRVLFLLGTVTVGASVERYGLSMASTWKTRRPQGWRCPG